MKAILLTIFVCFCSIGVAQYYPHDLPKAPSIPQAHSLLQNDNIIFNTPKTHAPQHTWGSPRTRAQNRAIAAEVEAHMRQQRMRQMQQQAMINEAMAEFGNKVDLKSLPSFSHIESTVHYRNALAEFEKMLTGKRPESVRDAIYLAENAYHENTIPSNIFEQYLNQSIGIIRKAMKQENYPLNDEAAKKMVLHQFLTGVIEITNEHCQVVQRTQPISYGFDDPLGLEHPRNMFVSKLIDTRKGQCNSMPLLYLMLAEALDIDAWLSFAPNHSFIKLQDSKGKWHNLEMTNGQYATDDFMMLSGLISSEAVYNGIYLDTLSKKELITHCLANMIGTYTKKYGYDAFVLEASNLILAHAPKSVTALMYKANYQAYWLGFVGHHLRLPDLEAVKQHEFANSIMIERDKTADTIDKLGYTRMSMEQYKNWLASFNNTHKSKFLVP